MADDGSKQSATWPMPKFRFSVDLGSDHKGVAFQEISGLDSETQVIEYRHSNSPEFSTIKMPGISKSSNVTLKRGVFVNDNLFWDWYNKIKMNTIKRETVVIMLQDEEGKATMTWTLHNAWPTKITSTDMKSEGNEVAVDTLEIAHEKLEVTNGG